LNQTKEPRLPGFFFVLFRYRSPLKHLRLERVAPTPAEQIGKTPNFAALPNGTRSRRRPQAVIEQRLSNQVRLGNVLRCAEVSWRMSLTGHSRPGRADITLRS
jgi:hypothetical protein